MSEEIQEALYSDDTASATGYKCPSCGAQMTFSPEKQALVCGHCGTEKEVDFSDDVRERSFEELFDSKPWNGEIKVVQCQNCGAKEVLDKNEISTKCPFCGSSSVLELSEVGGIKPDTAIPFKISEKQARGSCLKWIKSRFFSPSKFKKDVRLNEIKGCYCPVWTFDSDTVAVYSGRLGKHYTETRIVNGKTVTVTKTRYFNVSGQMRTMFDDIYVKGSEAVNENYLQRIQPYDMNTYVKYDDKMLAGYAANHYTVEPLEAWQTAEARMKGYFRNEIVRKYNADEVASLSISLIHQSRSFKYLMLPVYISAVNYKDKLYNQYINGVSGKVAGSVPKSIVKIGLTVLLGIAAIVGIYLLMKFL